MCIIKSIKKNLKCLSLGKNIPDFLTKKKIHILQKNSGWQAWLTFWSMYNVSFLRDALYFYDFDLYKTQKTRVHSLQNLGVFLMGCMML